MNPNLNQCYIGIAVNISILFLIVLDSEISLDFHVYFHIVFALGDLLIQGSKTFT